MGGLVWNRNVQIITLPKISLATLGGRITDPQIAVETKMRDVLKVRET